MDNMEEKIIVQTEDSLVDGERLEEDRRKVAQQQAKKEEKKRLKKKKRRRIILIVTGILMLIAAIVAGILFWKSRKANEQTTVSVKVGRGETVQYARINSIVGNEMSVTYVDESEVTGNNRTMPDMGNGSSMPNFGDGQTPNFGDGQMPNFGDGQTPNFDGGSMPDFGDGSSRPQMPEGAEMPDFGDGSSRPQLPEGAEMPDFGDGSSRPQLPEGSEMPDFGDGEKPDLGQMPGTEQNSGSAANVNKTVTLQIPVGTEVYTKLGNVTTFSRLAAGDTIAIIFEEGTENILRIYMQ